MDEVRTILLNLGYEHHENLDKLHQAINNGPPSKIFIDVITWLTSELEVLYDLESHVSSVTDPEDCLGFFVEISSLLKELSCPMKCLTSGQIAHRLDQQENKLLLLSYLSTELQAAKIQIHKKPKKKEANIQIDLAESKTAKELREMLISMNVGKPPDNITPKQLFTEVEKRVYSLSQPLSPKEVVGNLLFSGYLTEKQWFQLEHLYKEMYQEYKNRRILLLTRLDVTVESFRWAERLKSKAGDIISLYNSKKSLIPKEPTVKVSHVLAAKTDLTIIEKTSGTSVRRNTKSSVNKVIIGSVPDRGGRPEEQQPPPPEVPSWQKQEPSSRGTGRPTQPFSSSNRNSQNSYENARPRSENFAKGDHVNRGSYKNENFARGDVNRGGYKGETVCNFNVPVYQTVDYYSAQLGNPQFGFGGYMPAGDNFQQYGANEFANSYSQGGNRGSGRGRGYNNPRGRGGRNRSRW